jgi:hypothetical protein
MQLAPYRNLIFNDTLNAWWASWSLGGVAGAILRAWRQVAEPPTR